MDIIKKMKELSAEERSKIFLTGFVSLLTLNRGGHLEITSNTGDKFYFKKVNGKIVRFKAGDVL